MKLFLVFGSNKLYIKVILTTQILKSKSSDSITSITISYKGNKQTCMPQELVGTTTNL